MLKYNFDSLKYFTLDTQLFLLHLLSSVSASYLLNGDNALNFHMGFTMMNELSVKHSDSWVMSIIEKPRRKLIILFSEQGLSSVF